MLPKTPQGYEFVMIEGCGKRGITSIMNVTGCYCLFKEINGTKTISIRM
jgi:hypothetical protein